MADDQPTTARTVHVHLADAPTDVLVWLVERPQQLWWTVDQIVAAVAPPDADHALPSVSHGWAATVDGQNAVTEARCST